MGDHLKMFGRGQTKDKVIDLLSLHSKMAANSNPVYMIHAVVRGAALLDPIKDDRVGNPDQGEPRWEYTSDLMSR